MSQPALNRLIPFSLRNSLLLLSLIILTACGGGGGGGTPTASTPGGGGVASYSVGGTLTGLYTLASGTVNSLVLRNKTNNTQVVISSNGSFTFPSTVADGSSYDIEISSPPSQPTQTCTVSQASGTVAGADVSNITVECLPVYSVGGTVSGLKGTGLVLQINQGDNLTISADGNFTFGTVLSDTSFFDVTVLSQPANPAQTCTVSAGRAYIAAANVTNVQVQCARWQKVSPFAQKTSASWLKDIASNGQIRVAVGSYGDIQSSTDGTNWVRQESGTRQHLQRIIWSTQDRQFVAVGAAGTIITSSNGINWVQQQSGSTNSLLSISWRETQTAGEIQYVAVGQAVILTSPNGVDWSSPPSQPAADYLFDISNNGQRFVAVGLEGEGVMYSSDNGVDWVRQAADLQISESIEQITWSDRDNQFVALGFARSFISADGITWLDYPQPRGGSVIAVDSFEFSNNQYIAVNTSGIFTSDDAINWTLQKPLLYTLIFGLVWDGAQYTGVGSREAIIVSPDAQNWTAQNAVSFDSIYAVEANLGGEYLFSTENGKIFRSTNGVDWTKSDSGFSGDFAMPIMDIVHGGRSGFSYMMVGMNGVILENVAGRWRQRTSPLTANTLRGITYNNGLQDFSFVAVGDGGTVLLLTQRGSGFITTQVWQAENSGTSENLYAVTWNDSQYVAVGANATIITSPNGVNWTTRSSPTTAGLQDIVWGNGQFIAVGGGDDRFGRRGGILTSTDGVNWSIVANTSQYNLRAITWNGVNGAGSEYVAIGGSTVLRSADGVNWSEERLGLGFSLQDITWNSVQQQYMIVDVEGGIYLSQ